MDAPFLIAWAVNLAWALGVIVTVLCGKRFWACVICFPGGVLHWIIWAIIDTIAHRALVSRIWDGVMICAFVYLTWQWWRRRGRKEFAERLLGYKARAIRAKLTRLAHQP